MKATTPGFFGLLRCPECGHDLAYGPIPQHDDIAGDCGLLRCACFAFPVLDGIPIFRKNHVAHRSIADDLVVAGGPTTETIVAQIEAGDGVAALLDLLAFPVCPWPLNRISVLRSFSHREPHRALGLAFRKRRLRRMLARRDELTAEDWLDAFYWHSPVPFDPFNYFFFRYGQPRHLAALALLATLPARNKPVLDLACGYGHMLHYLTICSARHTALGLDQNFHQLWVAKHYVAPGANFVCADADQPLPFKDGTLAATVCADAFHYFTNKTRCVAEMRRCSKGGTIMLTGASNRLMPPEEDQECTPDEYGALLDPWPYRVRGEAELVAEYLEKNGADLSAPAVSEDAAESKWLYLVATEDEAILRKHGLMPEWPHAVGKLEINPLYTQRRRDEAIDLTFRFPSPWYAFENERMAEYLPASVALDAATLGDLRQGRRTRRVEPLIAQVVALGLPLRYARPSGRPWTMKANRALTFFLSRT
ncbi:MAG: class I SAM-dependent methyltransferase [Bacteroidetes bacterium]|nr:class I SAM-dependent methyltransferase [Bacteroidota bacterium]